MEKEEVAIHLRMLQTFSQVGTEKNSTLIVPLPIEALRTLLASGRKSPTG
jgi:hypothetical protein